MKLAVVGSRTFNEYPLLCEHLAEYEDLTHIVSGGARGADSLAQRYAEEKGLNMTVHLPDWDKYGKSAGFRRNQYIVDEADAVIAFWDGNSVGTKHTIDITRKTQKYLNIVRVNSEEGNMSKVTGMLDKAYRNDKGFYSINVNDTWYGTGRTDCSAMEKQMVEFDAEQNGKYWNAKNVVPASAPASGGADAPAQSADARQKSIVLQSSYKVGAALLAGLIAGDKVGLGAKSAAFDNAKGLLDELTLHIYHNCMEPDKLVGDEDPAAPPADDWNPTDA